MTDIKTRRGIGVWIADLAMGFRFAVAGGRSGWIRAGLTALGVGLGVAMLLGAASIPTAAASQDERNGELQAIPPETDVDMDNLGDNLLILDPADTTFRDVRIAGYSMQATGSDAPTPPGVDNVPREGEMYVSPDLAKLLASDEGELLRPRLDYKVAGTIADEGLHGPGELRYYVGSDSLSADETNVFTGFGEQDVSSDPFPVMMILLIIVAITVMLLPVVMFVAVAVRFGGERRDRRLAALRLVGADAAATRRMAAGESLLGALAGLGLGAIIFIAGARILVASRFLESLTSGNVSVFVEELYPDPVLAVFVIIAIPLVSIMATQLSMRRLVIEPLGVVRQTKPRRRRLWWRLLLVAVGIAAMVPILTDNFNNDEISQVLVVTGVLALLLGMAAVLPWLLETVVARMRGGAVSWQLATRRLQLGGGGAFRAIVAVSVAVAGAVALQMLFTSVESTEVDDSIRPANQGEMNSMEPVGDTTKISQDLDDIAGVTVERSYTSVVAMAPDSDLQYSVIVADCQQLRKMTELDKCDDGGVYDVQGSETEPEPGVEVEVFGAMNDGTSKSPTWKVPAIDQSVKLKKSAMDLNFAGLLVTPAAIDDELLTEATETIVFELDPERRDAVEDVRNFAVGQDTRWSVYAPDAEQAADTFAKLSSVLYAGVVATMILIGISLLVSTIEQLQERRRLMSVLVAFGARRRSLVYSVLWQTAIPVGCGLIIATGTGIALGAMLAEMTNDASAIDWWRVGTINAAGAAMVLVVTLFSLPPLWRMMRPAGIRTE